MLAEEHSASSRGSEGQDLKGICPFCLSQIDVHLDVKRRPYWRCWRCEVRTFGTQTSLRAFVAEGWIWSGARPVTTLRTWLAKVARLAEAAAEEDSTRGGEA